MFNYVQKSLLNFAIPNSAMGFPVSTCTAAVHKISLLYHAFLPTLVS